MDTASAPLDTAPAPLNPFAFMMDPESVLVAIAGSERLSRLHSRICRPLDRQMTPRADAETASFDELVDAERVFDC